LIDFVLEITVHLHVKAPTRDATKCESGLLYPHLISKTFESSDIEMFWPALSQYFIIDVYCNICIPEVLHHDLDWWLLSVAFHILAGMFALLCG